MRADEAYAAIYVISHFSPYDSERESVDEYEERLRRVYWEAIELARGSRWYRRLWKWVWR